MFRRQLARQTLALLVIIGDQVEKHALDVIAEPAAPRIDAAQIAVKKAISELLEQVIGRVLVAESAAQVATDSVAVAIQQLLLGRADVRALGVMRQADQRPQGGNPAQVPVRVV